MPPPPEMTKAVAILVIGTRSIFRGGVEFGRHRAHRVEQSDKVQSSSSPPPANITSCLPHWIISRHCRYSWRWSSRPRNRIVHSLGLEPVADRLAYRVEDIDLGTAKGPMRLGWNLPGNAAAATMALVAGPPEPTINPVRGLETSLSSKPGVCDSLVHCYPAVTGAVPLKAPRSAVHHSIEIDLQTAMHLAAKS